MDPSFGHVVFSCALDVVVRWVEDHSSCGIAVNQDVVSWMLGAFVVLRAVAHGMDVIDLCIAENDYAMTALVVEKFPVVVCEH